MSNEIELLSRAEQMLATVARADEAAKLADMAEAARVYARKADLGTAAVNHATIIKARALKRMAELVAKVTGYQGEIRWDTEKPNGTPRKLLDVSKATALGWIYRTELEEGIRLAYLDFLHNPMRAER